MSSRERACAPPNPSVGVFAVFYSAPGVITRLPMYKLVAVPRGLQTSTVLEASPDSLYWDSRLEVICLKPDVFLHSPVAAVLDTRADLL